MLKISSLASMAIGVQTLRVNPMRTVLSTLGIIIAVMSIITVVSMVEGFGNYVTDFLRGLGTNMMVVYPEAVWYGRVTPEDADEIFREHVLEGRPVERLRIDAGGPPPAVG